MATYKGPSDKMTDVTMQGGAQVAQARQNAAAQTERLSAQSQQMGSQAAQTIQHREDKKQEYQQHQEREVAASDRQNKQIDSAQATEVFRQQQENERQRRQMSAQGIEFDPATGEVRHNQLGMTAAAKRSKDTDIAESRLQLDTMKFRHEMATTDAARREAAQKSFDDRFYAQRGRLESAAERLRLAQFSGGDGDSLSDLASLYEDRPDMQATLQAAKGGDANAISRVIEDYTARIGAMDIDYIAASGRIPQGMNYNGPAFIAFQTQRESARTLLNGLDKAFTVGQEMFGGKVSNPFGKTPSERQEYLNRIAAQAVVESNLVAAIQAQTGGVQSSPLPPAGAPAGTPQSGGPGAGGRPGATGAAGAGGGSAGGPGRVPAGAADTSAAFLRTGTT